MADITLTTATGVRIQPVVATAANSGRQTMRLPDNLGSRRISASTRLQNCLAVFGRVQIGRHAKPANSAARWTRATSLLVRLN